jgi:ADP-heptose:LPS heptosyltransferase
VPWARHFNRLRKYNPFSLDWISLARTILALRKRQFDWGFSGRMDVRDNLLLWLSGARRRIGYGIGGGGSFLTDRVTPDLSRPHRAHVWLHLLEALGVGEPLDPKLGGFHLAHAELASARLYLASLGIASDALLIGVHPGARIATRRWGDERFAEVARRVLEETNAHVLWFSEPGTSCQPPQSERCHAVSLDFRSFVAALSLCRLLVCNDSGPMHLANLLAVPVVTVFGPQRPEWFGPRGPHDRVVIRPEFSCRPCFDYCIFDQPYCLRAISTDEVHSAVENVFHAEVMFQQIYRIASAYP